jgi:hypothetical protein
MTESCAMRMSYAHCAHDDEMKNYQISVRDQTITMELLALLTELPYFISK